MRSNHKWSLKVCVMCVRCELTDCPVHLWSDDSGQSWIGRSDQAHRQAAGWTCKSYTERPQHDRAFRLWTLAVKWGLAVKHQAKRCVWVWVFCILCFTGPFKVSSSRLRKASLITEPHFCCPSDDLDDMGSYQMACSSAPLILVCMWVLRGVK